MLKIKLFSVRTQLNFWSSVVKTAVRVKHNIRENFLMEPSELLT